MQMDRSQQEIAAVEKVAKEASESFIRELDELQLALIGGGCGDPILA
jgi:hypothetical protein